MHLSVSIFLLFLLLTGGFSLVCYNCQAPQESPCEEQMTCDDETKCASRRILEYGDEVTTATGCAMPDECESWSFQDDWKKSVSVQCCDTDLCNEQDDSGFTPNPDLYYDSVDYYDGDWMRCFACEEEDCIHTANCRGGEDYCFTAKGNHSQSQTIKGCASKHMCDDPLNWLGPGHSLSCCSGNLCNGVQSVTQSFLFLCCSLLSFILLH